MPVAFLEQLPDGSKMGGWRFEETPEALVKMYPFLQYLILCHHPLLSYDPELMS